MCSSDPSPNYWKIVHRVPNPAWISDHDDFLHCGERLPIIFPHDQFGAKRDIEQLYAALLHFIKQRADQKDRKVDSWIWMAYPAGLKFIQNELKVIANFGVPSGFARVK
jgi:hypothetical protein